MQEAERYPENVEYEDGEYEDDECCEFEDGYRWDDDDDNGENNTSKKRARSPGLDDEEIRRKRRRWLADLTGDLRPLLYQLWQHLNMDTTFVALDQFRPGTQGEIELPSFLLKNPTVTDWFDILQNKKKNKKKK